MPPPMQPVRRTRKSAAAAGAPARSRRAALPLSRPAAHAKLPPGSDIVDILISQRLAGRADEDDGTDVRKEFPPALLRR